ncbi:MAG: hypothetical protein PHR26_01805 [Candidatus ainarchaeum sp.]|nr:hypothetical protein [Candidatus ainarchaeum sp.]MDD3975728.1 hypothetical protein [Candidatus ainarchaeum sp.]
MLDKYKSNNLKVPDKSVLKKLFDKLDINQKCLGTGWPINNC